MICEIPHKMDFLATNERQESLQDSLRRSSVKLGTMQRIFAWPNTCVHVLDPLCICMCPCMCLHMVYVRARLLARSRRRRHIQTCARMRGWRNTVEANLEFDETVPSVVHAHTSNLRPAKDPFARGLTAQYIYIYLGSLRITYIYTLFSVETAICL